MQTHTPLPTSGRPQAQRAQQRASQVWRPGPRQERVLPSSQAGQERHHHCRCCRCSTLPSVSSFKNALAAAAALALGLALSSSDEEEEEELLSLPLLLSLLLSFLTAFFADAATGAAAAFHLPWAHR